MILNTSHRSAAHRNAAHHSKARRQSGRRAAANFAGLTTFLVAAMLAGAAQASQLTSGSPVTPASSDKAVARTLAQKPASGWSSIILKAAGTLTPAQEAQLGALGADITRRLPLIGSVAVRVPARRLAALAALPFVTHLSSDGLVQKSDDFTVSSSEANQAIAMGAGQWGRPYQPTGKGVTVAVIDSGVTPLPDLAGSGGLLGPPPSRLLASVNFANTLPSNGHGGVTYSLINSSGQVALVNNGNSYDPCGHGTHIAGIIAGNGARSAGPLCFRRFDGIAPQAGLVSVRVLDQNGSASVSSVISGLQWVVANKAKYNIRVLNLSLGHPVGESYKTDPLCQAVEAAYHAGIVVVCAAGNTGRFGTINVAGASNEGWGTAYGSIQSPANDPYIITVGAAKRALNTDGSLDANRTDDKIATYSSRGPSRVDLILKPDIIAPGNKVISLDAGGSMLDAYAGGTNQIPYGAYTVPGTVTGLQPVSNLGVVGSSGDYFQLSGTSMAAPVVAGAAALLLQVDPTLTPDTVKARLMLSADKWAAPDGLGDALTYGAGYLNIPAAITSTAKATQPALSPALKLNSDGTVSLMMDRAAWGSGLWGTGITDLRAAWGSSVGADRAAWGCATNADGTVSLYMDRAAWGCTALAADRAAWGCNFASADRAAWGCSIVAGSSSPAVDLTSTAIAGE